MLGRLPSISSWITSLPQLDLELTVPSIDLDCPICANTYLPNLLDNFSANADNPSQHGMPLRLPCGHILCEEWIRRLLCDANATAGLVCPFCRTSHDHVPISHGESWQDILEKCMWIALETFTRLHEADDFQDMEAVTRWAQDFQTLCLDVPDGDKREAIGHALEYWLNVGEEAFSHQLAERVYAESQVEFTFHVSRPFRGRLACRHRGPAVSVSPLVLIPAWGRRA